MKYQIIKNQNIKKIIFFILIPLTLTSCAGGHSGGSHGSASLKEPGNDIFGTIQEAIKTLEADDNTDWELVDLEALRQHLIDMQDMTVNVRIVDQTDTEKGMEINIEPTTERSAEALSRVLKAHPPIMKAETGWDMQVQSSSLNGQIRYKLLVTTEKSEELSKMRALGYIGIMAYGNHHQPHHYAMASGKDPHSNGH